MCNCYSEIKGKLAEHFKAKAPAGAEKFEVDLGGYVYGIQDDGGITHRSSNQATVTYMAPKKAGGMKKVTDKTFVRASYCPFCGENYSKSESTTEAN